MSDIFSALTRHLPSRWHGSLTQKAGRYYDLVRGIETALEGIYASYQAAQDQSIAMRSSGVWLTLHLLSLGIRRPPSLTDERARELYRLTFEQTRNTRSGILRWLSEWYGLEPPNLRLETDFALGKFGQFRLVYDNLEQSWQDVDLSWTQEIAQRFVANGVVPGIDVRLGCLLHAPLNAWKYDDQLFASWNFLGPLWERPSFSNELRLADARNSFFQVTDLEWQRERGRLREFHFQARSGGSPGAIFVYLTDRGQCPYLLAEYDLQNALNLDDLSANGFVVDGFQWFDPFDYSPVQDIYLLDLNAPVLPLDPSSTSFPATAAPILPAWQAPTDWGLYFKGVGDLTFAAVSWTTREVLYFVEVETQSLANNLIELLPRLQNMVDGPWKLTLGEGDPDWGLASPAGDPGPVLNPIATLDPASIWWTDQKGEQRSTQIELDDQGIAYLAVEFLYPKGKPITIRELELTVNGELVHYRRLALPLSDDENLGIIFRVAAQVGTRTLLEFPAFRSGQSKAGDPLRDRDYVGLAS